MKTTGNAPGVTNINLTFNSLNQIDNMSTVSYDPNGNVTQFGSNPAMALTYDVANRLATVTEGSSSYAYAYDSANRRVYYHNAAGTETIYLYGADGKKLATYTIGSVVKGQITLTQQSENVYFAGRLISAEGSATSANAVAVDGMGSVRWSTAEGGHTYAPYGAEYVATANNTEKYATYTRDTVSGLDYAMNRYYNSTWGRFMTPDPHGASARSGRPQSWNRYVYAGNDPVNRNDSTGLDDICGPLMTFFGEGCYYDPADTPDETVYDVGAVFDTTAYLMVTGATATPDPPADPEPPDPEPDPEPPQQPQPPPPSSPSAPSFFELAYVSSCVDPLGAGITAVRNMLRSKLPTS